MCVLVHHHYHVTMMDMSHTEQSLITARYLNLMTKLERFTLYNICSPALAVTFGLPAVVYCWPSE